jgi:hypothetical protein
MLTINLRTGEVLDFSQWTDEEILVELQDLEEIYRVAKEARDMAKNTILARMEQDGAKLRMTDVAEVRVQMTSRVRDARLVEQLHDICPPQLRDKCFRTKLEPKKAGLNELAKLGSEWQERVDAIYEQVPYLKIEWQEPKGQQNNGNTPF